MLNELPYNRPTTHQLQALSPLNAWLSSKQADNDRAVLKLASPSNPKMCATPLIAVVDDEPVIAITLAEILSKNGLPAVWFTDSRRALSFISSATIDVLLSDISMPHLDGLALARGIHALQPSCALLLFSGLANEKSVQDRVESSGLPIRLAAKPLCPRYIVHTVRSLIGTPVPPDIGSKPQEQSTVLHNQPHPC